MELIEVFIIAVKGYWGFIVSEVMLNYDYKPVYQNYFYGLILVSLAVWALELLLPWRKDQSAIRKDFWLDGFYMFFNFFIFGLMISGFFALLETGFVKIGVTMESISLFNFTALPLWVQLLIFFILNDFVQWFTHVLLHRFEILWRFHRVHHSVQEMGFAAHLRYHWMENIFYKPLKTLVVMVIGGFEPNQAFFIHFVAITIGHLNHANVRITWGPFKYIVNNSVMHLYHHAKALPEGQMPGVNFGISLSLWDYIFRTNYIPQSEDGSYELGFDGIERFPVHSFWKQLVVGFKD
jgi:sterol desaturase/sphingolipid hydroxylase (fatty acid hydroxylase superfamily)